MFGVSFLAPLFLIGALAAAVPILLHLFHRKTDVVIDFPSVRLLTRAPVQQHRRRQLRELILLALRVAALILLAVSFARPYVAGAAAPVSAPVTVVLLDTSMSLSAPGQFASAQKAASQAVQSAPASDAVALITFADSATVTVPPTSDRGAVLAAIAAAAAGAGGTRYRTALASASEVIGAREARVVIVTDLQQAGWEANDDGGIPDGVDVRVVAVAGPRGNLAVTSASRRDQVVIATVQNYGADEARAAVQLMVEGKEVTQTTAVMAPFAAAEVELRGGFGEAGTARVVIEDATGYQPDNARFLPLDPPPAVPIAALVADPSGATGGIYIERALSVADEGPEFAVTVADGRVLSEWTTAEMSRYAALVILGTRTLDRGGRALVKAYLAGGGQVLLTLGPDVDPGTLGDVIGADLGVVPAPVRAPGATLVASDSRHPIFRPFLIPSGALGDVQVDQYRRLKDQEGRTVLARLTGGDAALTEQVVGQGRLLVFVSDLDNQWSRFPLQPSFVPFAVETARYLTHGRQLRQQLTLPEVPAGAAMAPGVVTTGEGAAARRMVVNVDVRESSPAATTVEEFTNDISRTNRSDQRAPVNVAREVEERQRWWQVGLLVMLVALAGEALVGRRAA
ncbi:MAG: VWA domain-containing protein [Acidobacteria bacterium]|nr:VWA domain-containing protein [Acidobacteriota bacterium]MSO60707.1 VWA domain-containing protein [Acidobacteriota bacterium]